MNEEYILNIYNQRGGQSIFGSYENFKKLISTDEDYASKVYSQLGGQNVFGQYENFRTLTKSSDSILQPTILQKKNEDTTGSPSETGSLASSESADDLSSLAVEVQDKSILTKQPRESKPIVPSESTKTFVQRAPQFEPQTDEIDRKVEEIQQVEINKKSEEQKSSKELENNPIISFGKKFWETLSKQIPSSMEAKGAQTQSQFVESDMRRLKSIADVSDDDIIEMPSLTDPRGGNLTSYKAGEYKKLLAEKISRGNKAMQASIELALKLNKDLGNSDVISSLTQVNDGYDLLNFISSSVGQTVAQVPLSLATGGGMSYAMESGNIYLETVKEIAEKEGITPVQVIQQGKDQVALAEIGGAISGALELFGATKILSAFGLDNIKKDLRKRALTILVNSQVEGATEVGQEFVSSAAKGLGVEGELKAPTLTQALDAYAAGMFGAAGVQSPSLLIGSKKDVSEEIVQPVILDYGDSKFGFIRDESGRMEMTKELDNEEQAISMSNMLSKAYKGLQFTIEEIQPTDPYKPTKYKIVANEIAAPVVETTPSLTEELTQSIAAQEIIQEQAAGEVPVQEVVQGESQVTAEAGVQEEVGSGVFNLKEIGKNIKQDDLIRFQELSESLREGELLLKDNVDASGNKLTPEKRLQIEKSVESTKQKIQSLSLQEVQTQGVIPVIESAKNSLGKRLSGDQLLNSQDLIDELNDNKAEIDEDGMVTVYHRTTPENKAEIERTGEMQGLEDGVFFSTTETGQNQGYGDAVVKLKIPVEQLIVDDTFGDEAHLRIPTAKAGQVIKVKEYIQTETKTTAAFADELSAKYGVELELQDNKTDNSISVPKIVVPKDQRKTGVGTKVMEEVAEFADRAGKRLVLTPSTSFGGSSVKRLVDFYKSLGFVENKGKNKDFTIRDSMYRNPVPVAQEAAAVSPTITPEPITITDIKVSFAPENAIEVQKGTREDTNGRKFTYDAAVTAQVTDKNGTPIGTMTKRASEDGTLSFTIKNTKGQNINKNKAYNTERDARTALAEQVNRLRAKATPTPTTPVVEVAAPEPVVTPTPEPILVDDQEEAIVVTEKEIKSNLPKFTRDNAIEYDTDYKEDSRGRDIEYTSSLTVEALDIDGVEIGTITKLIDDEKNATYTAQDSDRTDVGRGKEYNSEAEVIKALTEHINKKRKKEFDKEVAKIVKTREKDAAKVAAKEAKQKAKQTSVEAEQVINSKESKPSPEALEKALNLFENLDKILDNKLKRNANDALLAIPLTTLQAAVKAIQVLIKGGIAVRDAIRRVAAENKIDENRLREAFVALTKPVISDLETEGVGVKLTGEEEVIAGENNPTVKTIKGYQEDYSADDIFSDTHAPNSRVITTAANLASGKISYTKDGEKITFQLPYLNTNLAKRIQVLREQYKAITSTSKAAKVEKESLKKEINKVAKKILVDVTDVMSQNLLALYDTLTPEFVKNSKEWYVGANRMANAIADKYDMTVEQVGGIIAALSPQNDWFNNVSVAERTIEIMTKYADTKLTQDIVDRAVKYNSDKKGVPNDFAKIIIELFNKIGEVSINEAKNQKDGDSIQSTILRAFDQAINSPKVAITDPTGAFVGFDTTPVRWNSTAEISKAINIFRNGDVKNVNENLGNGNKVRNFYNNIVDPKSKTPYVTADTHALSAALNSPMSANDAGGFGLFNGSLEPSYALVKEAYIRAAQVAGVLPREMQSITWEAQRIGINDKNRTEAKKQELFDYISESRKNKETAYERATELIARNRSADPTWGKADGIRTQKSSESIRSEARLRAEQRSSALSSLRGRTEGRVGTADTRVGGEAAGRKSIDEIVDLDVKSKDNLAIVSDFLDSIDRSISKRLKTNANDALLAIPLTVVQGIVKGLKVLVQGGMSVRDALKKIAADNNISQEKIKDLLSLIPIVEEFNALMTKADKLIANQKSKNIPEKKIVSNLDTMVRKFYEKLDINDAQRKIMEREARAKMNAAPRKAASIGRVLGVLKDIANVTRAEKLKIISRIRELGRDVTKDLASEIRELAASGKITATQAASIVARTLKINPLNEASVSNFVEYMAKVFSKADYVGKMTTALNQIKQAKKNIKTKIGVAQDLFEPLNQLLSINPTLIPLNQLEKYLGILEDFSARKAVLSVDDRVKVLKQVNEILDEIKNERSSVDALADRFNNYNDKVFNEDGELNYSETIKSMIDEGSITVDESELMKKYKSEILPQVEKVDLTDAEIEADKKKEIKTLKELKIDNKEFPLPSRDEKEDALNLAKLIKELSVEELMNLSLTDLKNIIKVIDNINNGYFPHYAKISIEKLNSIKSGKVLSGAIERANPLAFSKLYSRVKEKLTDVGVASYKKTMDELIKANPLYYIGDVFGDFKTKDIFNSLFEKSAQALSTFNSELKIINQKIEAAQNKVLASFRQNPDSYLMSKFRMTTYMLQREYESNVGKKGVRPVSEYLKETIKHIRKGKSVFKEADAEKLEKILKEVESYTIDEFYNTFNDAEKNAIKVMTEINASLGEKAAHTASVIRGNKVELMDNYFHHNVLHEQNPMDATAAPEFSSSYSNSMRPTTKAKSLIERTGALTPLNFDLFTSTQKGAKFVLLDYNMTSPIRTARRTLIQAEKNLESKGLMNKEKIQIFNAINNAYEEALENLLTNSIVQDPLANDVVDYIQKQGYRAALAGTVRFKAELLSNIVNALIINPKGFAKGIMHAKLIASANGYEFMKNAKSKQTSRLYASDALSGRMVDPQILKQTSGIKGSVSRGALRNRTLQIYNLTLKKYIQNPVEFIADTMTTTPDKVVSMPLWFGSFMNEFKKITGEEVNQEMMINNDFDYMQKNADAIEQATRKADQESVYSGAANNEFMGVLKGKLKPNQGLTQKVWNNFNSFMTNFMNFDYAAARSAYYNLFTDGYMTKKKAAAVLGGLVTRSVIYQTMVANMGAGVVGAALGLAFDWEDEEEVDEKTYFQMLGRSLANVLVGYTVGRNFGNAVRGMINVGAEKINEEYLDFLRNGEYDFYKDNIAYTYVNVGERGDIDVAKTALSMAGPYTPALNTVALIGKNFGALSSRVMGEGTTKKEPEAIRREEMTVNYRIPLELAGNAGLIPFYKDVKRAVNDEIYKDLRKAANTPESSITTPDEYDKLKDLKELKNKTKNQEERRAIDKKIVEIVGSKEAKDAIDKQKEALTAKKKSLLYDRSGGRRYNNESDMKRLNPALWRKRFGPNSDWDKKTKAKEAVESKLQKESTAREDKEFKKNKRGN